MEIVIVVIVALCILLTWGPRVLLAVIVTPFLLLALVFAFIVIKQELATKSKAEIAAEWRAFDTWQNQVCDRTGKQFAPENCMLVQK